MLNHNRFQPIYEHICAEFNQKSVLNKINIKRYCVKNQLSSLYIQRAFVNVQINIAGRVLKKA